MTTPKRCANCVGMYDHGTTCVGCRKHSHFRKAESIPCEKCNEPVVGFVYTFCCSGAVNLCDCGGEPTNTCLCPTCLKEEE